MPRRAGSGLPALPALLVVGLLLAVPAGALLRIALFPPGLPGVLEGGWSAESFASLADGELALLIFRTGCFAVVVTLLATLLGFPAAFVLSRSRGLFRKLQTLLLISPLLTPLVVRAFGWSLVFGRPDGAEAADGVHAAVVLALTEAFLPFMALPLAAGFDRVRPTMVEAARGLGAGPVQVFVRLSTPLVAPAFLAGAAFVFVGALSAFAAPALLGGASGRTLVVEIHELAVVAFDWPTAAAASVALLLASTAVLLVAGVLRRRWDVRQ